MTKITFNLSAFNYLRINTRKRFSLFSEILTKFTFFTNFRCGCCTLLCKCPILKMNSCHTFVRNSSPSNKYCADSWFQFMNGHSKRQIVNLNFNYLIHWDVRVKELVMVVATESQLIHQSNLRLQHWGKKYIWGIWGYITLYNAIWGKKYIQYIYIWFVISIHE